MIGAYRAEAIRAGEQAAMAALPPGTLMVRAAAAIERRAAVMMGGGYGRQVVLLVGSGDNGGDALYAGALLARRGAAVTAVALSDRHHQAGFDAFVAAGGRPRQLVELPDLLSGAHLVIDGIVGIGGSGALRDGAAQAAAIVAEAGVAVLSVDLPSGVDADTGCVVGQAITADVTVTMGALKPGLLVMPGRGHAGVVEIADIGVWPSGPPELSMVTADDVAGWLPVPGQAASKYRRGVVGILAGSEQYPGAAVLAVAGALGAGAGMVRIVGPEVVVRGVLAAHPEVIGSSVADMGHVDAVVVGPGVGHGRDSDIAELLSRDVPAVIDADALGAAGDLRRRALTIRTPHEGELARMLGVDSAQVAANRLERAREAVARYGGQLLLKGAGTLVVDAVTTVNPTGTPLLATAGSGDVLAGVIGALAAARCPEPARAGAFIHGLAGVLAAGEPAAPIAAGDVARALGQAARALAS